MISCCSFPCFTSTYREEAAVPKVSAKALGNRTRQRVPSCNCNADKNHMQSLSREERVEKILSKYLEENNKFHLEQAVQKFPKSDLHRHACPTPAANLEYAAKMGMNYDLTSNVFTHKQEASNQVSAQDMLGSKSYYHNNYLDAVTMRKGLKDGIDSKNHFFSTFNTIMSAGMPVKEILEDEITKFEPNTIYSELTVDFQKHEKADLEGFSIDDMENFHKKLFPWLEEYCKHWISKLKEDSEAIAQKLNLNNPLNSQKNTTTVGFLAEIMRTVSSDYAAGEDSLATFFADSAAAFMLSSREPERVLGINVVGPEDDPLSAKDYSNQMKVLKFLREKHPTVNVTIHTGEMTSAGSSRTEMYYRIHDSIEVGGAVRIGHGLCIKDAANATELLREMKKKGVTVEVCLSSNQKIMGIQLDKHPLKIYVDAGVKTVIATDHPHILNTDMTKEYYKAMKMGLTYRQIKACIRNSVDSSFIPGVGIYKKTGEHIIKERFKHLLDPSVDLFSKDDVEISALSKKAFKQIVLERNLAAAEKAIIKIDDELTLQKSPPHQRAGSLEPLVL